MNDPKTKNVYVVVKQVNKFDGKEAGDVLEWQTKLCTALSPYNRPIFNVLQRVQRLSSENIDGAIDRASWNIMNRNLLSCSLPRPIQLSRPFADSKERGPRGRSFAIHLMAICERLCVRSITK